MVSRYGHFLLSPPLREADGTAGVGIVGGEDCAPSGAPPSSFVTPLPLALNSAFTTDTGFTAFFFSFTVPFSEDDISLCPRFIEERSTVRFFPLFIALVIVTQALHRGAIPRVYLVIMVYL